MIQKKNVYIESEFITTIDLTLTETCSTIECNNIAIHYIKLANPQDIKYFCYNCLRILKNNKKKDKLKNQILTNY